MIKRCIILGCGSTGAEYKFQDGDYVIGVNDCWKFGTHLNELLFLNPPHHFNELGDNARPRIETIKQTSCNSVVCLVPLVVKWKQHFPVVSPLPVLTRWIGQHRYSSNVVYHTNNSPFTAMSYAVRLGFKEIVLFGVDFANHKHLNAVSCAPDFSEFSQAIKRDGVKLYKGSSKSRLVLEVYKQLQDADSSNHS